MTAFIPLFIHFYALIYREYMPSAVLGTTDVGVDKEQGLLGEDRQ